MNNEQNGLGSFIPNNTPNMDNSVIPGANIKPVGVGEPVAPTINNNVTEPVIPAVMPAIVDANNNQSNVIAPSPISTNIPNMNMGIVDNNVVNNNMNSENTNNSNVNTNNILNSNPIPSNDNNVASVGSSPFDIGLGSASISPSTNNNNITPPNSSANIISNSNDSQPFTNETADSSLELDTVSVGSYLKYMILFSIPVIGLILLLIKAFSKKENKNISNFAKALLILQFLAVVLSTAIVIIFSSMFINLINLGM